VANGTVLELVHLLDDTEVYQVRLGDGGFGALKLHRRHVGPEPPPQLLRERNALLQLGGDPAPRLLEEGAIAGSPFLLTEWCPGIDCRSAAADAWSDTSPEGREFLVGLCLGVAGAYARLHRRGVFHGDVHPRNVLVDPKGGVRLIDFGLARIEGASDPAGGAARGGVPFYFDPELAASLLADGPASPLTAASEQYSLAALLYLLLTGRYYLDFDLERSKALGQILEQPPVPFVERDAPPMLAVEAGLRRALAKDPGERFRSVAELAAALSRAAAESRPAAGTGLARRTDGSGELERAAERLVAHAGLDGDWLADGLPMSTPSVAYGAAGIAFGFYRISCQRDDPELLALADLWTRRAETLAQNPDSFRAPELMLDRGRLDSASPLHAAAGVCAVSALVADARREPDAVLRAAEGFVRHSAEAQGLDLAFGHAGTLQTCALLYYVMPESSPVARSLVALAERADHRLDEAMAGMPQIAEAAERHLGIAHGWAGFLHARLQWSQVRGHAVPAAVERRLEELAALHQPARRGLRWPWLRSDDGTGGGSMPGWCNGSAGFVFLWSLAASLLDHDRYLDLASGAAWHAWEAPPLAASLCCGLIGRAYALLNLYRVTGDREWLDRARRLGARAAARGEFEPERAHSLHRGEWALAVLAADLSRPERSAFPFFEREP
jgi:serine/threonine-protein kinase